MWWQTWIFNIDIFFFKIILIESSKEQAENNFWLTLVF